ncbi:MAG: YggS family pyridoxal phosphate-dependent enzyme [Gemmatimonadetes bacterium]|nr:YggS family pyridoxal phosphate-dependent enzyme [Gemmatimonadota bacterium]
MYFERLARSLPELRQEIAGACARAGRADADDIVIVAVAKGHPVEAILAAHAHGLRIIGESRVAEGEEKRRALEHFPLQWHLVGHLQRNKVRRALAAFHLLQSVDSVRLAKEIEKEAAKIGRRVDVLAEVNASGEATKFGIPPEDGLRVVSEIARRDALRVLGVMAMAPLTRDERVLRSVFRKARECFERCRDGVPAFEARHLSMGMTNDYTIAVEEGATMVRLGTALFGERGERGERGEHDD